MSVTKAYEKMFKDGSAFNPIKIAQPTPDNPNGGMGIGNVDSKKVALGEVNEDIPKDSSWAGFDSKMQEYIESKKKNKKNNININDSEIKKLESRIDLLEDVVKKIMKAQMDILKNG